MGHASRSIPIITEILKRNIPIVLASDGDALLLLQKEFPNQVFETLPAYNIHYAEKAKHFDKTIFLQLNKLGNVIKEEHLLCEKLIEKHQITHIISDNRYGCYHKNIPSVIICHQLTLQHKNILAKKAMNSVHFKLLNQFSDIWAPDFEAKNALAGKISKTTNSKLLQKLKYLGAVSRMKILESKVVYDYCFVLSGPEPQRTLLENIFWEQIKNTDKKIALVRGISSPKNTIESSENISVFNLLTTEKLNELICQSHFIICRAGYSSIMDLVKLKKTALLIPTPGQTEQEYLAENLAEKGFFTSIAQEDIDLAENLKTLKQTKTSIEVYTNKNLEEIISSFLDS